MPGSITSTFVNVAIFQAATDEKRQASAQGYLERKRDWERKISREVSRITEVRRSITNTDNENEDMKEEVNYTEKGKEVIIEGRREWKENRLTMRTKMRKYN